MNGLIFLFLRIALALALFAFLGWAIYTLWRDLQRSREHLSQPQVIPLSLIFDSGGTQRTARFTHSQVTIGRDPASDCYVEDATISAHHARLSYHHGQWWVEDLRSTNGTFLNQQEVIETLVITNGDVLRCGQISLQITLHEEPQSQARRSSAALEKPLGR